jgi:hypothetical protein
VLDLGSLSGQQDVSLIGSVRNVTRERERPGFGTIGPEDLHRLAFHGLLAGGVHLQLDELAVLLTALVHLDDLHEMERGSRGPTEQESGGAHQGHDDRQGDSSRESPLMYHR